MRAVGRAASQGVNTPAARLPSSLAACPGTPVCAKYLHSGDYPRSSDAWTRESPRIGDIYRRFFELTDLKILRMDVQAIECTSFLVYSKAR